MGVEVGLGMGMLGDNVGFTLTVGNAEGIREGSTEGFVEGAADGL